MLLCYHDSMTEFPILYEDGNIVAISKPAGVVVHPDHQYKEGTVVDWLRHRYPGIESVGENSTRPGVVHRLDKDTSGVLVLAKTETAHRFLKEAFQKGEVQKTYLALVQGRVREEHGVIDAPIARSTKHFEKRVVGGKQGREREAITYYKVTERFPHLEAEPPSDSYTLLEVSPKTGRTHQIRSHLAFLGNPIVCDKLYSGKRYVCPHRLHPQFLHASALELTLPSGGRVRIEADLPPDLEKYLGILRSSSVEKTR